MSVLRDILSGAWVHYPRFASSSPYLRLMRIDKPVGIWLLMWPCFWSIIMSSPTPRFDLLFLFFIGSIIMRGAACVVNDLWDMEYDRQVARTKNRPLASGEVTIKQALKLLFMLLCFAFVIWLYLPTPAQMAAVFSLVLVALYPLAKRYTHLPQMVLGFTINLGALIGGYAAAGDITGPAWLIYLGCVFWTFGYDTIYGHQDKEDDSVVGIKSSALLFGDNSRKIVSGLYHFAGAFWLLAGVVVQAPIWFYFAMAPVAYHLFYQMDTVNFDKPESCLRIFKSNVFLGFLMFIAAIVAVYA